jgi:hypothetical protein
VRKPRRDSCREPDQCDQIPFLLEIDDYAVIMLGRDHVDAIDLARAAVGSFEEAESVAVSRIDQGLYEAFVEKCRKLRA